MLWQSDSPCGRQGHRSPGRRSSWQLEFRDCGAIPGRGLLLTAERRIEGMWGRRLWWEMPVEESRAAMEAKQCCWVTHSGWSHHHSLSLPTHQHRQQNNREAGPSNTSRTELQSRTPSRVSFKCLMRNLQSRAQQGGPRYVPGVPNREGHKAREPSKCLNGRATERLAKKAFWLPATRGLKKDTDMAVTPVAKVVHFPAH